MSKMNDKKIFMDEIQNIINTKRYDLIKQNMPLKFIEKGTKDHMIIVDFSPATAEKNMNIIFTYYPLKVLGEPK